MATKWTDGWLCRDKVPDFPIVFYPTGLVFNGQVWCRIDEECWEEDEWPYDLKPPAKGKKFYVEIQV